MSRRLTAAEYKKVFWRKEKDALEHALETRKFEIELYWKRAAYFWTFITAALAAYGVIRASKDIANKEHLSVLVGVLGLVFSFAWRAVNRGSKHWQENWENHVALLEDEVIGPLYKTVSERPREVGPFKRIEGFLTGPFKYSVSKVNQLVSLFVVCVWPLLIWEALPPFDRRRPDLFLILVIVLGVGACVAIWLCGRSHSFNHEPVVKLYTSVIKDEVSPEVLMNTTDHSS
jgi:hypothetical protein